MTICSTAVLGRKVIFTKMHKNESSRKEWGLVSNNQEYIPVNIELVCLEEKDVILTSSINQQEPFDPNGWV